MLDSATLARHDLAGRRIIVVEDEFLVADELVRTLRRAGAEVVGAAPSVTKALALIQSTPAFDAAVIDINLGGEVAYPVVEAVIKLNRPFVFATVCQPDELPHQYRQAPRCAKPLQGPTLLRELQQALSAPPPAISWETGGVGLDACDVVVTPALMDQAASWIEAIAALKDKIAFGSLFSAVAPKLKRFMLMSGANSILAEELAQETLQRIWRRADEFDRSRTSSMAWIFAIARDLRCDRLQWPRHSGDLGRVQPATPVHSADEPAAVPQITFAALGELPGRDLDLLRMCFMGIRTHEDIARLTGLSLDEVKLRLSKAIRQLRTPLK